MACIPRAEPSPRIVNGVLRWYQHDTFSLFLDLDLRDDDGEAVTLGPNDGVAVAFRDRHHQIIKEFMCSPVEGNCVELVFNEDLSRSFIKGEYRYDVVLLFGIHPAPLSIDEDWPGLVCDKRQTIVNDARAVVE